jgi:hypothetical protein
VSASIRGDTRTCHGCGKKGHIRPYCPDNKYKRTGGRDHSRTPTPPSSGGGGERTWKPLASWKYIEPKNITKAHIDEDKQEWKLCTKYVCKATKKQGLFQLSHFDADHDPNFSKTMPATTPATRTAEVNLTRVDDPNGNIPLGPTFTSTRGPEGDENGDNDALEFQGAWCCSFDLPPELRSGATITVVRPVVESWESDDDSDHDSMPVLAPRRDDSSSDEDSDGSIPPLLQRNDS